MSAFQLFVTALNQSEPNDAIRKTNFARFVSHLHNMQYEFTRKLSNNKHKLYREWDYFNKK